MDVRGRILVLENKKIEFEKYEEALSSVGILCDVMGDADDFLDRVVETIPDESTGSWNYTAASLDLKVRVPSRARLTETSNGGAWIFREVLRPNVAENDYLNPGQARVAAKVPVSFLTNYSDDEELVRLHREYDGFGQGFAIIKKRPDVTEYVAWAENAVEVRNRGTLGVAANHETMVRYSDACLTVIRLCQSIKLPNRDIFALLTGGTDFGALVSLESVDDLATEIMQLYPAENVLAPAFLADRWEAIAQIVADTYSVFNHDPDVAIRDLTVPLKSFDGQSYLQIMKSGSNTDIVALLAYHEQRWGRS